jgi:hypothetical protein
MYMGEWWLPDQPQKRVTGQLLFSPRKGMKLKIQGVLGDSRVLNDYKTHSIICGVLWGCPLGDLVTLHNNKQFGSSITSRSLMQELYRSTVAFFGNDLLLPSLQVNRLSVQFSGLSGWANSYTGIQYDSENRFKTSWVAPSFVPEASNSDLELKLLLRATCKTQARDVQLREQILLNVVYQQPLTDANVLSISVIPLQNFLTLATNVPNKILAVEIGTTSQSSNFTLVFSQTFRFQKRQLGNFSSSLIPFQLESSDSMNLMIRWLEIYSKIARIVSPYFALLNNPGAFLDLDFIGLYNVASSLQSHSPTQNHNKRESLANAADLYNDVLVDLGWKNGEAFAETAHNLFVYISNRTTPHDQSDFGFKLYKYSETTKWLIKMMLMRALSISDNQLRELVYNNADFAHTKSILRKYRTLPE